MTICQKGASLTGALLFCLYFTGLIMTHHFYSKEDGMIYLTSKQEEALSPVKREVYQRRLMRDLERRQEEAIRKLDIKVPAHIPIYTSVANCIMWTESSRLRALTAAAAMELQESEKLKTEIASLYEES